jgi:hypothetical protein
MISAFGAICATHSGLDGVTSAFWSTFWPNLWSGIVAGLVTGLAVGFVIWFVQKHSEERRYRREYEMDWLALKEDLPVALSRHDIPAIDSLAALPAPAAAVSEAIKGKPLEIWRRELPQHSIYLNLLAQMQNQRDKFIAAAEELHVQIQVAVRNANRSVWSGQDSPCIRFINGRVYGAAEDQVTPWLGSPELPIERLREVAETVLGVDDIAEHAERYVTLRAELVATTNEMASALEKGNKTAETGTQQAVSGD